MFNCIPLQVADSGPISPEHQPIHTKVARHRASVRTVEPPGPREDPTLQTSPDAILLGRIAEGDQTAFWVFWGRYHQDLYRTYYRLCKGNKQEVHDSLSGLCIRLADDLPSHARSINNSWTWLRRTAVNHFIDCHRAHRRRALPVGSLVEVATLVDNTDPRDFPDPERANADRMMLNKVTAVLRSLSDARLRKAAHMRFFEDESYATIAAEMSVSEELARKWIQQVRVQLRRRIPELADGIDGEGSSKSQASKSQTRTRNKGGEAPKRRRSPHKEDPA